jgi:amino acid adenylation domain-containing protein
MDLPMKLTIVPEEERQQQLHQFNNTHRDYPADRCLHELFLEQAEQTPDIVAIVDDNRTYTYGMLNERSASLARRLKSRGVGPGQGVALWSKRSAEGAIGILGILRTGAHYVPLPTDSPADRLASILDDSRARLIVASIPPAWLSDTPLVEHVLVCHEREDSSGAEAASPRADVDSLFAIMYTSGTTGVPKGVCLRHRGFTNLLWHRTHGRFERGDFAFSALTTPWHFDGSIAQMFSPLITGGTLVVNERVSDLGTTPWYHQLTALTGTSSLIADLIRRHGPPRSARVIGLGAEPLPADLLDRLLPGAAFQRLLTGYGVTEASCYSTDMVVFDRREVPSVQRPGPSTSMVSCVGRPIANTRVYVLDERFQLLPLGAPGELFLAGVGVARGYLGRPELTAERFLPDPFSVEPGALMYRTGDRGRWRHDGLLEFIGRVDQQIKFRGFRVEPGEIESALAKIAGVRQSVVVAQISADGGTRLVAYIVADSIDRSAVRAHLACSLPDYMIPSVLVRLDEFPLTANGKIDREALPLPDLRADSETVSVPPRDQLERELASIWQELLRVDPIGIDDHVFRLGADSLLAAGAAVRVSARSGVEISPRAIFENPTVAGLAAHIRSRLSVESTHDEVASMSADPKDTASCAQQRLWFVDQAEGERHSAYNIATSMRLIGPLDLDALGEAFNQIVARHEPLRTTFSQRDGELIAIVAHPRPLDLAVHDLRNLAVADRGDGADRIAQAEADRPFDLESDLAVRATLVRIAQAEHRLTLVVHHIAADGWSLEIIWEELAMIYAARRRGDSPALPELSARYADYAAWQRRHLNGPAFERMLDYWLKRLAGLEPLELPTDRARPPSLSYLADSIEIVLPASLIARVREICRLRGVTPQMALLAVFQATLGRLTGRDDVAVGVPHAGRSRLEFERLVGCFVNLVVMRADLRDNPSFDAMLTRTRSAALDALEFQNLPFDRLVQELQPDRCRNRNPLVQVVFQLLDLAAPDLGAVGIEVSPLPNPSARVRFDIEVVVAPRGDYLVATCRYATDLFNRSTIERLGTSFRVLLEAAVTAPDVSLRKLPIVPGEEQRRILVEWNDTATLIPRNATIDRLFREQADRSPDAVALISGTRRISYAELDRWSESLAGRIRSIGVREDSVVALCLPRCPEQIVTILAILKAGAGYLALDPANPVDRNRFILRDSNPRVIVSNSEMLARLPPMDVPVLEIEDVQQGAMPDTTAVDPLATPRSLAYVIYTSGSTGEPKGVMVEHRSVVRLVIGQGYARLDASRVFLQLAPIAFDASTFEIWGPLLNGGTLVIAPEGLIDFGSIRRLVEAHRVTTLWLTAGLFNSVIENCADAVAGVSEILTGGEALSPRHVQMAFERLGPATRIINGYGPTECTTFACCHSISRRDPAPAGSVPIGRPIANTVAYILDNERQPVPIGVAGELYLGGSGVARGYLNRPELTAERFIPNPFDPRSDSRLYRTGDLVRWRADGEMEFLGRLDHQVKIRGYRVETGEIEAALGRVANIRQAVVVARRSTAGGARLVAYVVPVVGQLDEQTVREELSTKLPDYMIPSMIIQLDRLPLTHNGKFDRSALPEPRSELRTRAIHESPCDPVEQAMVAIWEDVLGVHPVGVHDDFFRLGGHSMLALRLLARISEVFGTALPVTTLLQMPTVNQIAKAVRVLDDQPVPAVVEVQSGNLAPPLICFAGATTARATFLGDGLSLAALARHLGDGYPVSVVMSGRVPQSAPCETLIQMVAASCRDEIRATQPHGPYLLAGHSLGGLVALEVARGLLAEGEQVSLLALFDVYGAGFPRQYSLLRRVGCHFRENEGMTWQVRARNLVAKLGGRIRRASQFLRGNHHPEPKRKLRERNTLARASYLAKIRPYPGKITLLRAREGKANPARDYSDLTMGWGAVAVGGVDVLEVPGDHRTMLSEPHIRGLADALRSAIRLVAVLQPQSIMPEDQRSTPMGKPCRQHTAPD